LLLLFIEIEIEELYSVVTNTAPARTEKSIKILGGGWSNATKNQ